MSDNKPKALSDAVQYMQQHKEQYSPDEISQQLRSSGYPENIIFEAAKQVFVEFNKSDIQHGSTEPVIENITTVRKIVEFVIGFVGYYILLLIGVGVIGLGVSIFLYFYFRKKRKYVARGILAGFIVSTLLIIVVFGFLFFMF